MSLITIEEDGGKGMPKGDDSEWVCLWISIKGESALQEVKWDCECWELPCLLRYCKSKSSRSFMCKSKSHGHDGSLPLCNILLHILQGWLVSVLCPQTGVVWTVLETHQCPPHRRPACGVGLPPADTHHCQGLPRALLLRLPACPLLSMLLLLLLQIWKWHLILLKVTLYITLGRSVG